MLLQHGLLDYPTTWYSADTALSHAFDADFYRLATTSTAAFQDQANSLRQQWSIPAYATVYVGQSNGGIVGREMIASNSAWRALVTVGSPNHGAPLTTSLSSGLADYIVTADLQLLATPIASYEDLLPSDYHLVAVFDAVYYASGFVGQLGVIAAVFGDLTHPVTLQIQPGSAYLNALNGSTQLAVEQSRVPDRFDIVARLSTNNGLLFRAWYASAEAASAAAGDRDCWEGVLLGAYLYTQFYGDQSNPDW